MYDNQSNERAGLGITSRESGQKQYLYSVPARHCGICGTWLTPNELGECSVCTDMFNPGVSQ